MGSDGSGNKIRDHNCYAADHDVAEPGGLVDLDGEGGVFVVEELGVDAEDELLVPRGAFVAVLIDSGGEFAVRIEPRDGESPHGFGYGGKVLRGDHVDLQELDGSRGGGNWRHF